MTDERRLHIVRMSREMIEEDPIGEDVIRRLLSDRIAALLDDMVTPTAEERARRRWGVTET